MIEPRECGTETHAARNIPVWDDERWEPLPPLQGDVDADVCVVGLGGSGLTCIGELLALGRTVVGLDARAVGGGAAGRNGGFLLAGTVDPYHRSVAAHGRERASSIYRLTLDELRRIAGETPDAVRLSGSLRIAASAEESEDCERQLEAMRADGLPAERYDGPEGHGLLIPSDGAFNPLARCRTLARRGIARGAGLYEQSPAVAISAGEVATPAGRVRCDRVIVAVDGRLEHLLPELTPRTRTARLQMLATAPAHEVRFPRPVYARWGLDYWQQLPDGRIALGGCRDRAEEDEWTDSAEPSPTIQGALDELLRTKLGVRAPVTHRWAASVSYTAIGLPVIEEARPGVWAIGGYSGTGNVLGAICGRAVANLAACGSSDLLGLIQAA